MRTNVLFVLTVVVVLVVLAITHRTAWVTAITATFGAIGVLLAYAWFARRPTIAASPKAHNGLSVRTQQRALVAMAVICASIAILILVFR